MKRPKEYPKKPNVREEITKLAWEMYDQRAEGVDTGPTNSDWTNAIIEYLTKKK